MPTVRKKGDLWHVQVRRAGHPATTKSFAKKGDAIAWGREVEQKIERTQTPTDYSLLRRTTLSDLLTRYRDTVTPTKRGRVQERYRLDQLVRHPIGRLTLEKLTPAAIADYRDQRMESVQGLTVQRELAVLRHVLEIASKEWGIPLAINPVRQIRLPAGGKPRDRRLSSSEFNSLIRGCRSGRTPLLEPIIRFAVETGLRRGELLSLKWVDLDEKAGVITVHETKNGYRRQIPLTLVARCVLSGIPRVSDKVFPISANALRLAWERLKERVHIEGLRFHDLRHEAISRFFEMGLSMPEVAMISGHRDPRMLFRYTHMQAVEVARKLAIAPSSK